MSGTRTRRFRSRGFTLIEVLVALAIIAIGMSAVLATLGSSADTASYLRDKTFAEWIALNHLAETRLNNSISGPGSTTGELDYAGRHWRWQQDVTALGFPGIYRIDVKVQQADTPQGKDAPWIGMATGAVGDAVAPVQSNSDYIEFQPGGPGTNAGTTGTGTGTGTPGTGTSTTGTGTGTTGIGTSTGTTGTGTIGSGGTGQTGSSGGIP